MLATGLFLSCAFSLQKEGFCEWAMLGSNQRPLPCEVKVLLSSAFAVVQNRLQNCAFAPGSIRVCSPLFAWVGVLLV